MKKIGILAVASFGLLAACQTSGTSSSGVGVTHVPTVTRTILTHDMQVSGRGIFASDEIGRLDGWLDSVGVRYGDQLSVDGPADVQAGMRRKMVADVLAKRGLMLVENAPVTSPALAAGTVRFVLVRSVATVPECPDFRRRSNPEFQASMMSNYGCATVSNLAAMIADPNDLVSGKKHAGVSAERIVKAVNAAMGEATKESVSSSVGSIQ